jgi:deazaflavin-dependent oxidoreductase (nitroreductase family)
MALHGEYAPSTRQKTRDEVAEYERTNGASPTNRGVPIVVVTSLGAKSGKVRKFAVMRVEDAGRYAVIASMGGQPKHPLWYHNLVAHPHVELQDGPVRRDYVAREAAGAEKAEWWARAVEVWPDYDAYQARTSREIPLFVLTPVEAAEAGEPGDAGDAGVRQAS